MYVYVIIHMSCIHVYTYVFMYIYIYTHAYIQIFCTRPCMHACMYVRTYVCIHRYICNDDDPERVEDGQGFRVPPKAAAGEVPWLGSALATRLRSRGSLQQGLRV